MHIVVWFNDRGMTTTTYVCKYLCMQYAAYLFFYSQDNSLRVEPLHKGHLAISHFFSSFQRLKYIEKSLFRTRKLVFFCVVSFIGGSTVHPYAHTLWPS